MNESQRAGLVWHKSSFSNGNGGNCVEVATLPDGGYAVRNSRDPGGAMLTFTVDEWMAYVAGVKGGEFD